jgi:peptidoglycan/xylan/chitin deacetylase (PgdA/CDA1 family)
MGLVRAGPPLLYLATAGGLALTARSLLGHPAPLPLAAGCFAGYLGLVAAGVVLPRLGMWGETICSLPGAGDLALTFELPPPLALAAADLLEAREARATFFVRGQEAVEHPDSIKEIIRRGHEVGTRGFDGGRRLLLRRPEAITDDLRRSVEAIERATGERPLLLQPPGGLVTPGIVQAAATLDLDLIGWTIRAPRTPRTARVLVASVLPALRAGAIVSLGGPPDNLVIEALPGLLDGLAGRGWKVGTLSAMLDESGAGW